MEMERPGVVGCVPLTRKEGTMLRMQRRTLALLGAAVVVASVAAFASSSVNAASQRGAGGSLTIADVAPFTGVDAALGPTYLVACDAAANAINKAGGVLGNQLNCKSVDTRGDPADAVPAVRQLYAGTSNLALVIGLTSDEAAAVVPIVNSNKTVAFGMTGQAEFDHIHFPYFYRLVPADLAESYAMVAIAHFRQHDKRVALAFGNDIGSQTFVGPAVAAVKKAGMKLVANETLDLKATTFRTEAAKIIAGHPDVILTEALGPAEAAFLSEVKQQNGGKAIPVIGTSATISPDWYKSVSAAVGASALASGFLADNLVVDTTGPAYKAFKTALYAEKGKVGSSGSFSTYLTAPGAVHLYDGINLAALAMVAAKSSNGSVYRSYLSKVANGKVTVHSFAQGLAALKKGQTIAYVGPGGPTKFNNYNESNGIFQIDAYSPTGQVNVVGNIPNQWMSAVR